MDKNKKLTVDEFFNLKIVQYRALKRHQVPEECLNTFNMWKTKDDEKRLEYRKRTRKEAIARAKKSYENNREHHYNLSKEYRIKNKERLNKLRALWEAEWKKKPENQAKIKETQRRYRERNYEKCLERSRAWKAKQPKKPERIKVTREQKLESKRLYDIEYRKKNAAKIKERKRIDAKKAYWRKKAENERTRDTAEHSNRVEQTGSQTMAQQFGSDGK